jgi:hypothetical protein
MLSLIDKNLLFYDFESFKYNWMVIIIDYATRTKTKIDTEPELRKFYSEHDQDIWIGYNSREYDQYILRGILLGYDPYFINTEIIDNKKRGWQIIKSNEYPLYNFDISDKFHSLKQLEGFMGSDIRETEVDFKIDRPLTEEELASTEFYCTHDVEEAIKVFEASRKEFDSQLLLIETFDLPMLMFNKTKAQLSAAVLEARRGKSRNDEFDLSFPDTLVLGEKYQYIMDWYKDPLNHNYSKTLVAEVDGVPHQFAWGGLHAALPNYIGDGIIAHCDVASTVGQLKLFERLSAVCCESNANGETLRERAIPCQDYM